ncbi:hypothetical protein [Calothrix sp. PCC 7507]|uniref:hypothetical protein n=1 Tax=Calothrix sp. PCC 7507 TaxID=99598 RepID=UPI00029F4608|nr:hypothetical protein [Calothrix sp. PCC 7507]AFY35713.1 hypothetical protein Cal7507_5378 [Calothrix sp. PCC 7507]
MRTTTSSVQTNPPKPSPPAYPPPSVPLSIYRELAAELHTTEAKLDALTAKNQQLTQENQLLRQEITKAVQAFLHLQKLVDPQSVAATPAAPTTPSDRPAPSPATNVKNTTNHPVAKAPPRQQVSRPQPPVTPKSSSGKSHSTEFSVPVVEMISPMPETIFIEEQEVSYYSPTEPESKEISGWWLVITILLIMLTAFGAGYLVVRPLFEHQSR